MGKNVEMSKYVYSAFVDSGASTGLHEFMTSALDVSKNAILSSTEQAISWDGAGLRLRKWANEAHTTYEQEQIWMNNNSIVMTDDGWTTAKMAVGKFHDENLGDCWGIIAQRIVGTMIAGESMLIESAKKDGGIAVFRVDGDGCKIYNSDLSIANESTHIILNPWLGFAIGDFPVYNIDEDGNYSIDTDNAQFWVDTDGNLNFKGTLHGVDGDFTGAVTATSLTIRDNGVDTSISAYVDNKISPAIGSISDLFDLVDGTMEIYYQSTAPTSPNANDVWYNTSTNIIKRYVDEEWVEITETSLGLTLRAISDAQATADGKIMTFAQSSIVDGQPTATDIGDLWIDTGDNNKLYRWSGSSWVLCRDLAITTAQTDAENAYELAESIWNGETGIYFTSSNVNALKLNKDVGLKITGTDSTYFQVKNNAMGFFKSNGSAMLYYQDGNMTLNGIIAANGGYIGGENGWTIGTNCIYSSTASTIGSPDGIYLGTSGISIASAIVLKPHDTLFMVKSDSESGTDDFAMKIVEVPTDEGQYSYTLYFGGSLEFDPTFVLGVEHGGTGGTDRDSMRKNFGFYSISSSNELENIGGDNGDLCILYSNGEEGATMVGATTTSTSTSPGYMGIGSYNSGGHTKSNSYFGYTNVYWNISSLANENVSTSWCRVGVGSTVSGACGYIVPLNITVENSSVGLDTITISFNVNLRPSGCTRCLVNNITNGVRIALGKGGTNSVIGTTTFTMPSGWQRATNATRSCSATIKCSEPIVSGEYYVIFYSRTGNTLMWIQTGSVNSPQVSIGAASGLYLKTGGLWKPLMAAQE